MRVITGKYKGRHFDVPRTFRARPTTDFAKENLFNVLQGYIDLDGARALDLFAGTGSITLELLSRGCAPVVSVERERLHYSFICQFIEKLRDEAAIPVLGDVYKYITHCHDTFDFIFADPPYALPTLADLPDAILSRGLLAPDGLFVLEHGRTHDFSQHPRLVDHRAYGSVNFSLFR